MNLISHLRKIFLRKSQKIEKVNVKRLYFFQLLYFFQRHFPGINCSAIVSLMYETIDLEGDIFRDIWMSEEVYL